LKPQTLNSKPLRLDPLSSSENAKHQTPNDFHKTPNNLFVNDTFYKRLIWILSVTIFVAVLVLSRLPEAEVKPAWLRFLPLMNAFLNGSTFIILLFSYYYIKIKKITIHRRLNITAMTFSTIFLLSYVTFHSYGIKTTYPTDHPLKYLYYFVLITHIILAAGVLPLVLISLYRGLTMQVEKHRKISKWSFPIWLYVTFTGVIVYLMISPYYKF
jgi:putative membrane protein